MEVFPGFSLVACHALQLHFLLNEHLGHIGLGRGRASKWWNCRSVCFVEYELDAAATAIRGRESRDWQQIIIALVLCVWSMAFLPLLLWLKQVSAFVNACIQNMVLSTLLQANSHDIWKSAMAGISCLKMNDILSGANHVALVEV